MAVAPKERRVELWCEDSPWAPATCVTVHAPADATVPILVTCGDDHVLFPDSFRDALECAAWLVGYHRQAPPTDRLAAWDAYFVPRPKQPAPVVEPVIENNQRALPKWGPNGEHTCTSTT
jgi:hypothetical protein